jgi:hypothetical protein
MARFSSTPTSLWCHLSWRRLHLGRWVVLFQLHFWWCRSRSLDLKIVARIIEGIRASLIVFVQRKIVERLVLLLALALSPTRLNTGCGGSLPHRFACHPPEKSVRSSRDLQKASSTSTCVQYVQSVSHWCHHVTTKSALNTAPDDVHGGKTTKCSSLYCFLFSFHHIFTSRVSVDVRVGRERIKVVTWTQERSTHATPSGPRPSSR